MVGRCLGSLILRIWLTVNNINVFRFWFSNLTKGITYTCISLGENFEEACTTKEPIQEVSPGDASVHEESGKPEVEAKHQRSVVFQDSEQERVDKTKGPTSDIKTPNTETRNSCLIKYNVSTTPYLQR